MSDLACVEHGGRNAMPVAQRNHGAVTEIDYECLRCWYEKKQRVTWTVSIKRVP